MAKERVNEVKTPSVLLALIPLFLLVIGLMWSVGNFGDEAASGANQLVLLLSGLVTLGLATLSGNNWQALENRLYPAMQILFKPVLILLMVGVLVGIWLLAGVIPLLIKLGLLVLSPKLFYAAACLLCAVVAISIGSSWTTAASIGIALVGIAKVFGLSVEITAGAVISGAYFGDKMSPLSDTTNLAPAVAEVDLFAHVKHMAWTGVPALLLSLFVFTVLGLQQSAAVDTTSLQNALLILEKNYQLSGWLLLPLIVLMTLAYKQVPAFPSLVFGAFVGAIVAVIFQPQLFQANSSALTQLWLVAIDGYEAKTGDSLLDELLSGGGAVGMLNTIWLIVSAIFFGCAMEISRFLSVLIKVVLKIVHGTASLIAVTVGTGVLANIVTCEQYLAILLPGRMYRQAYLERGLDTLNLSRALEDSATVTSPLVPWNTCGAFMAATLGVATLDYMAFSFFNLFMPLLSIAYGLVGFKMRLIQCSPDAA